MSNSAWIGGAQTTIQALLEARLGTDPDSEYLDVCGTKFTAAQVDDHACRIAQGLAGLGVRPGDRVATLLENSPEAMLAWWGAVRGGHVAVPVNTAYKGQYLRHQLADSGSSVLIVCFVVVVIGGIGSITGALVAALLVGVVDTFGKVFFAEWSGVGIYVLMAVILVWRPEGLMKRGA